MGYFSKKSASNFHTKVAQIFVNFWVILKASIPSILSILEDSVFIRGLSTQKRIQYSVEDSVFSIT